MLNIARILFVIGAIAMLFSSIVYMYRQDWLGAIVTFLAFLIALLGLGSASKQEA